MAAVFLAILLCLAVHGTGVPYGYVEDLYSPEYSNDDANEVSEEGGVIAAPGFVSDSLDLVVTEGDTIVLPCIVTRLEGFVLLWKRNGSIISVGEQVLARHSRYSLQSRENGNNLMISLAEPGDEGSYVCQVSALKPTQLQHRVRIRVLPSIQTSPEKSLTVREGDEARLYCRVVGEDPRPGIIWRRKEGKMPAGEEEIVGEAVIFSSVTRDYAGTYQCVVEEEYVREVTLHVEYAPVIEIEQAMVKTGTGQEYHITCTVQAYPPPAVVWTKDGQNLQQKPEGILIKESGARHTAVTQTQGEYRARHTAVTQTHGEYRARHTAVTETHGEYSCKASNELGMATKSTQVSAYAEEAQIRDTPLKSSPQFLQIEWTAQSETPITIFRLQFMSAGMSDWSEVDVTATQLPDGDWYGKADLTPLLPRTRYQVKVSSLNTVGYSQFSRVHSFTTHSQAPANQKAISLSSSPKMSVASSSCFIILMLSLISTHLFVN
jgi:hypothetical protein